jgi:hypothetical protein
MEGGTMAMTIDEAETKILELEGKIRGLESNRAEVIKSVMKLCDALFDLHNTGASPSVGVAAPGDEKTFRTRIEEAKDLVKRL